LQVAQHEAEAAIAQTGVDMGRRGGITTGLKDLLLGRGVSLRVPARCIIMEDRSKEEDSDGGSEDNEEDGADDDDDWMMMMMTGKGRGRSRRSRPSSGAARRGA